MREDQIEMQRKGSLVLEAAARIVTGSIECGMLGDVRTIECAIGAAEFLRQHAEFVRSASPQSGPFKLEVR